MIKKRVVSERYANIYQTRLNEGGKDMTPKDTIEKSLIELKIQLHNEEINAETFLDTVATLREMFIRSGRRQIDWMMLTSQAEKAFIAILEQEQERRQEQAQTS